MGGARMGAGRKPKPTELKILAGNPGGRPLNENEPKPEVSMPDAPDHLDKAAREEWNRVVPILFRVRIMTDLDVAALASYCQAYGRWVEAEEHISEEGCVVIWKGFPMQNPYLSIANKAMEQIRQFMSEMGMTPSSRSRVQVQSAQKKANPFTSLPGGKPA